jgi:chorismate mutase
MTRAKKAKRDDRVVAYVRIPSREHAQVVKIAEARGYPHTIASVLAEMISRSLKEETEVPPRKVA